jgi:lipid-binding SYLF domain-containing protein
MILALNTDAAVDKFTKNDREWEMGVDASVAVAKVGAGGALDTTNLKTAIVVFLFGEKGLMGDVSFQGSRFKSRSRHQSNRTPVWGECLRPERL